MDKAILPFRSFDSRWTSCLRTTTLAWCAHREGVERDEPFGPERGHGAEFRTVSPVGVGVAAAGDSLERSLMEPETKNVKKVKFNTFQ